MTDVKEILSSLGYRLTDNGKNFRARPLYRESNNDTSLCIDKNTGSWFDFGINESGSFGELIKITLGLKNLDEANNLLQNKFAFNAVVGIEEDEDDEIKQPKIFDKSFLSGIIRDHTYWVNRGISAENLGLFEGGIDLKKGKMQNRYIFPIFNSKNELIGVQGRDLTGKAKSKWKIVGQKSEFKYPLKVNYEILKRAKNVILVESIGDMLSLWECGFKNTIVCFGTEPSLGILNLLLKLNPQKIIISFNNDENNSDAGNKAAKKTFGSYSRHFDEYKLNILLPPSGKNDWNQILTEDGKDSIKTIFQ
jgi:hypothetical protein